MKALLISLFLVLPIAGADVAAPTCASTRLELFKTTRLQQLLTFFDIDGRMRLLNQTRGTYVEVEPTEQGLSLTLYTTGFMGLFAIKRTSLVSFCDDGQGLIVEAKDFKDKVSVENEKLVVGQGGDRQTFGKGQAPEALARLHDLNSRAPAADGKAD